MRTMGAGRKWVIATVEDWHGSEEVIRREAGPQQLQELKEGPEEGSFSSGECFEGAVWSGSP